MDQLNLISWAGRQETLRDVIPETRARQIAATFGLPGAPRDGDAMPGLWHWMAFAPDAPTEALGVDGHPRPGDFLPPIRRGRRMWAGGALRFHAALRVGEPIERRSELRSIEEKTGAAGDMVFVTVDHRIYGAGGLAVEERQDIVYLPFAEGYTPPKKRPMPEAPDRSARREATETLLFRYSALTFNAHRIHYDLAYARDAEHYPGLVVHGPLQATWLMQLATTHAGRRPDEFHYRGVHPLFAGNPVDLAAVEEDGVLTLCTGQDGHQGMTATAIWQGTV